MDREVIKEEGGFRMFSGLQDASRHLSTFTGQARMNEPQNGAKISAPHVVHRDDQPNLWPLASRPLEKGRT